MAQGPQARLEALEKQLSVHMEKFAILAQRIVELTDAGSKRDSILRDVQSALDRSLDVERRSERERDELKADLRALRTTVDSLLIARNQGAGKLALLEDAQIVEPTEEEKQAEEDRKALLEYLRKVDADG